MIELLAPETLKDYNLNAKNHPKEQIAKLSRAFKEEGFHGCIVVDENLVILAGHGRKYAAIEAGLNSVPVQILTGLTEEQKRSKRLGDNKLAESDWLDEILKQELTFLTEANYDLTLSGFEQPFLLEEQTNTNDTEECPNADDVELRCALGETWQLGPHILYCADSSTITATADIVFTDPPYELDATKVRDIICKNSKHFVILCTFKQAADLYAFKSDLDFRFDFVINAHIPKSFMNSKQPYYTHQTGVYFSSDKETIFDCKNAKGLRSENAYWHTIVDAPRNTQDTHGHAKNIQGMCDVLSGFKFETIFDPFAGSGMTIIASEKMGKKSISCELDPKYASVIIERWEKYTGKVAVKIG